MYMVLKGYVSMYIMYKSPFVHKVHENNVTLNRVHGLKERRSPMYRRNRANRWREYERKKKELQALHLPLAEFEARLQNAAKELKA